MIEVKEIDWGIASRIGDKIYINKKFNKYPQIKQALLKHEYNHSKGYNKRDISQDISIKELKGGLKSEYYKIILGSPSMWIEYLPFWIQDGKIQFNPTITVLWILSIIYFGFIFKSI